MRTLYMNLLGEEKRIAVEENGKLAELFLHRPNNEEVVGNIYRGRIVNVLPGMQAAFVDIGMEKHAYLRCEDLLSFTEGVSISQLVHQGQKIIVQVVKEAMDTKGPKVTTKIEFPGKYVVHIPSDSYSAVSKKIRDEGKRNELLQLGKQGGFVFRSACERAPIAHVQAEMGELCRIAEEIQASGQEKVPFLLYSSQSLLARLFREIPAETVSHIIVDDRLSVRELAERVSKERVTLYTGKENIFHSYGIEHEIDKALKKVVWLEKGAYLLIEQTETMTVIDVNTGKFTGKQTLQDTVRKTNEAAAIEIARQLRLRDIGGMILIDFINMKDDRDKEAVRNLLIASLKKENTPTRVFGFTALGILEVTRNRKRKSLRDMLEFSCSSCNGRGFVSSPETEAYRLQRELLTYKGTDYEAVLVECSPDVQTIFRDGCLQEALTVEVYFADSASSVYHIRHMGTRQEVMQRRL